MAVEEGHHPPEGEDEDQVDTEESIDSAQDQPHDGRAEEESGEDVEASRVGLVCDHARSHEAGVDHQDPSLGGGAHLGNQQQRRHGPCGSYDRGADPSSTRDLARLVDPLGAAVNPDPDERHDRDRGGDRERQRDVDAVLHEEDQHEGHDRVADDPCGRVVAEAGREDVIELVCARVVLRKRWGRHAGLVRDGP